MGPSITRSLGQGFRAASRSWAGIGFFAGSWILVGVCVLFAVAMTGIPEELVLPEPPVAERANAIPGTARPTSAAPETK